MLTVMPRGVKSGMNSGRYTDSISAAHHAKTVVDKLGWEKETEGSWRHYLHCNLVRFPVTGFMIKSINASRMRDFLRQREEEQKRA